MAKLTTDLLCGIRDKADAELIGKAAIADGMVVLREAAVRKTLMARQPSTK